MTPKCMQAYTEKLHMYVYILIIKQYFNKDNQVNKDIFVSYDP